MIQQVFNTMIYMLLAKFMINDLPHAAGLYESGYEEPPTPRQLRYIAILCMRLKIQEPLEEGVSSSGEAGRLIRELEAKERIIHAERSRHS